jgi:hypothetical protein
MGLGKKMFKRRKVNRIKQERSMGMTNQMPIGSMTLGALTELIDSQIEFQRIEAEDEFLSLNYEEMLEASEIVILRAELEATKTKLSVAELALDKSRETSSELARFLMKFTEQTITAEEPELWPMNNQGGVILIPWD